MRDAVKRELSRSSGVPLLKVEKGMKQPAFRQRVLSVLLGDAG